MTSRHESDVSVQSRLDSALAEPRRSNIDVRPSFAEDVARAHSTARHATGRGIRRAAIFVVASGVTIVAGVAGVRTMTQQTPVRTLAAPLAEFPQPFSEVRGVRELSDGRVVVNDFRDTYVKLVDFRARTAKQIGGHGNGPGEYQMPVMILPLGRDTTAVYDMANSGDMVLVLPDGSPSPSITTTSKEPGVARITIRSRGDGRGFIYSETRAGMGDSLAVERYDRATNRREYVAYVSPLGVSPLLPRAGGRAPAGLASQPGGAGLAGPPFESRDQWAVANDGRVAVAAVEEYRITFTETDGRRWTTNPIPTSRIRVTEQHKAEWRASKARPLATISINAAGNQVASFTTRPVEEPLEWPAFLPAFLPSAVSFAPNGMLWVQRTTAANGPDTFDVIDAAGRLSYKLVFPPRTHLAGFGANVVYAVRLDNDDFQYLQKYPLPGRTAEGEPLMDR